MSCLPRSMLFIVTALSAQSPAFADAETEMALIRAAIAPRLRSNMSLQGAPKDAAQASLDKELQRVRATWLRNRKDPVTNFHVGYLLHAGANPKFFPERGPKAPDLDILPPGKSVELDVLRWMSRYGGIETPENAAKGEALLKRSPNDVVLIMRLTIMQTFGKNADRKRALELVDSWLALEPKATEPLLLRGLAHMSIDDRSGGSHAQKAIGAFEDFLRAAPREVSMRPAAEAYLRSLRKLVEKRR